jgi:hypothetical protein
VSPPAPLSLGELIEHWTLRDDEAGLVSYLPAIREASMTGRSPSFSMRRILSQDQSGGVYASTSGMHWRAEAGARAGRGVPHPLDRQVPGGFRGVMANVARIDLDACSNTNPQKRAGP